MSTKDCDVAIVGGGAVGCMTAKKLAPDHEVIVFEKDQIAGGETGRATGNNSAVTAWHDYPDIAEHCISFFRNFDGTRHFNYTERPRVTLVPEGYEQESRAMAAESSDNGFDTQYLTADEIESKYPGVFNLSRYIGGIEYQDMGWVDPHTYTVTLQKEAEASGAEFYTGTEVSDVLIEDSEISGVNTDQGVFKAENVVVAANWRTRQLLKDIIEVPVKPFLWETVDLDPGKELPMEDNYPMGLDLDAGFYWRQEHNGNIHIGGSERLVESPGTVHQKISEDYKHRVAEVMPQIINGMEKARFIHGTVCRTGDSTTPDVYPIIDEPDEGPDGLIIACGTHLGGVLSSPMFGTAIRSLITDEDAPFEFGQFTLNRFDDCSTDFEFKPLFNKGWDGSVLGINT